VQVPQRRGRVGAERPAERAAEPLVRGEGLRGAAGRGKGAHQLPGQLLAQRVRAGEVLQLGDDRTDRPVTIPRLPQ
jgi:hypothetical protein